LLCAVGRNDGEKGAVRLMALRFDGGISPLRYASVEMTKKEKARAVKGGAV